MVRMNGYRKGVAIKGESVCSKNVYLERTKRPNVMMHRNGLMLGTCSCRSMRRSFVERSE